MTMEMDRIFCGFGIEIFSHEGRYFLRYDDGEINSRIVDIEVSEEDALRAQISEKDAYRVIIDNE